MRLRVLVLVFSFFTCAALAQDSDALTDLKHQWQQQKRDTSGLRLALEIAKAYKLNQPDSLTKYAQWVMKQLGDHPREEYMHFAAEACYDLSIAEDRRSNFDNAIALLNQSKNFYDEIDDELGVLYAEVFQAWVYYDKGEVIKALEIAEEAKKELEGMVEELEDNKRFLKVYGNVLSDLGTYYIRVGKSDIALTITELSLEFRQRLGDRDDLDETRANLASIFFEIKDFTKAEQYYNQIIEDLRIRRNNSGLAVMLSRRAGLHKEKRDYSLCEKDYLESLKIRKSLGDKKGTAHLLKNLAILKLEMNEVNEAKSLFVSSLNRYKEINYKLGIGQSLLGIAQCELLQGDSLKSLASADSSFKTLSEVKYARSLLKVSQFVKQLYKYFGMHKDALSAAEMEIWAQNEIKSEEAKDEILKQDYQNREASANRNVYFAIAGAIVLLIIAMLLFRAYRLRKKAQGLAEKQKELVEERNKNMVDSIQYAQQLQSAILPSPQLFEKNFSDHFLIYLPKDIVAGDFYWFYENDLYRLWAVADCTGHGVPGAMVSVVCSNALNRVVKEYNLFDPGQILTKTRELVVATFQESQREVKDGMDIALCCLEKQSGQITFSGANRPCWVVAEDGELQEVKGQKQHIGLQQNMMAFESVSIQNKSGWIVLTSDGMADQFGGPQGKKWMAKTLKQKVSEMAQQPGHLQKMNLEWAFQQWKGATDQIDDVCVLGVKI